MTRPRSKVCKKSAVPGRPFASGYDRRRGRGPKPGMGGRTPTAVRDWARQLLDDPTVVDAVASVLRNPRSRHFVAMWKAVADRAYGKPEQSLAHEFPNGAGAIVAYIPDNGRDPQSARPAAGKAGRG